MALTHRQVKSTDGVQGTSVGLTFDNALVASPNLLAFISCFDAKAGGSSAASDVTNGAYTRDQVGGTARAALWSKLGALGVGTTPQVTIGPSSADWFGAATVEVSGDGVSVEDVDTSGTTGTDPLGPTLVVTTDCIIYAWLQTFSGVTLTPLSGWDLVASSVNTGFSPYSLIRKNVAAGSHQPGWTSSGNSISYEIVAIALKEAASSLLWLPRFEIAQGPRTSFEPSGPINPGTPQ